MSPDTTRPCDVVIVGGGPVGLLLASELAERDLRVAVLERAPAPSPLPKANGIVGQSALELAERGFLDGTGLRVVSPPRFQFGPLVLDLGIGPENPLHILPVPQRRLEELLERRAAAIGAQVHRGCEVTGFSQGETGVTVEFLAADGGRGSLAARYVAGCDGAHSFVRKQAGIGFPGFTSDEIARIARVTIASDQITRAGDDLAIAGVGRVAAMRTNPMPGGGFTIAPAAVLDPAAPGDLYLVSTHEPRGEAEASDSLPEDELRASLRRVLGADLPFTEAAAARSTVGNSRQADAYRDGRVFLAGDAAHIFNAGGSALNVGLQDAFDLARRLASVIRDGAPGSELDGYEAARRPAGERALQHTRAQAALGRRDEGSDALRQVLAAVIADPTAARSLAQLIEAA
jgi:2-polyprenyl-6-methoxyphenol hydroxylase-like FAD-dependent oxidoreductase